MEEIQVTWKWTVKVWWSWFWRAMLWTFPTAFAVGFVIGMASAIMGLNTSEIGTYSQLLGGLIGLFFGIYALKVVLTKKFNGYRLALVKTESSEVDS
ncbi:hypothetical protein [Planctobacterium marinum]|uniref:Uncharacterized protein n=1 Tax=Planctobacterium marinum TaxID=1631968 RepID=A0AA48KMR5_9ALTE|nr:hypothetical protein MACH26_02320 [Planctobacterium marinum]